MSGAAEDSVGCVVRQITQEAELIRSYELVDPRGGDLPAFTAGAHVHVKLGTQACGTYSVCSDPAEPYHYMIAVKRNCSHNGGSALLHEKLALGSHVVCSRPHNDFALEHPHRPHVLIAGGIGITPILAMLFELRRRGTPLKLFYSARSKESMPFFRFLSQHPARGEVELHFSGTHGRLNVNRAVDSLPDADIYVCGPRPLIDATLDAGPDPARVRYELFGSSSRDEVGAAFDCVLARSGRIIRVSAEQTLLDALRIEQVDLPSQCGLGVCGTCAVRHLEGAVDHRDDFLSMDQRQEWMIPCVSRARAGRIVIDV